MKKASQNRYIVTKSSLETQITARLWQVAQTQMETDPELSHPGCLFQERGGTTRTESFLDDLALRLQREHEEDMGFSRMWFDEMVLKWPLCSGEKMFPLK